MQQIRDTFPALLGWGERARTSAFVPEPGSPLAADDGVFPWLSTSQVAWQALVAAQDHLKGFRGWVVANDAMSPEQRPGYFPIATFSLFRSALIGGAIASWVLAPNDHTARTGRSLAVAADWYRHHIAWGEGMALRFDGSERHADALQHSEHRLDQVRALRSSRLPKGHLKTTTVITEATAEIWPYDAELAAEILALWRSGSGDAHALGWPMLTRPHEIEHVGGGMGEFKSALSSEDVASALIAYDFVAFGFHRLDELGSLSLDSHGST